MFNLERALRILVARYQVGPGDGYDGHHNADYRCVVHCECRDHYYRARDCKHIQAWLLLYDVASDVQNVGSAS